MTTRTHTEEMLAEAGADITVEPWGEGRSYRPPVSTQAGRAHRPGRSLGGRVLRGGGRSGPGSAVDIADIYSGPARLGFVSVLQRMGADITRDEPRAGPAGTRTATIRLRATTHPEGDRGSCGGDPLARRGPGPGGRGRRRGRHHGLPRRGRAPGQGDRPAGRRGRTWSRRSAPPRGGRHPFGHRVSADRSAAPASTAGAITGWPWQLRSRRSPPRPVSAA